MNSLFSFHVVSPLSVAHSARRVLSIAASILFLFGFNAYSLDCPKQPIQATKDWDVEVNAAVAKIGKVSGGELKTLTKNATQDLLGKLPNADRIYLEQMMFSAYCSALRDDQTIPEAEKAKRLREYIAEVRRTITQQPAPQPVKPPKSSFMKPIESKVARFGLLLGWQLGRYELVQGSTLPEAKAVAQEIEQDIQSLLEQDGYPNPVSGVESQQLIHNVVRYYGVADSQKHAMILLGIAALRVTLVGVSANPAHNDEMQRLAHSAIEEIDSSVLPNKEKLFNELIAKRPASVTAVMELLNKTS